MPKPQILVLILGPLSNKAVLQTILTRTGLSQLFFNSYVKAMNKITERFIMQTPS